MSGNMGVQGWNGELGGWMVAGRFTGLLDKFPTLGFFSKLDFGLSMISTGASYRIHRVSYRMRNSQHK